MPKNNNTLIDLKEYTPEELVNMFLWRLNSSQLVLKDGENSILVNETTRKIVRQLITLVGIEEACDMVFHAIENNKRRIMDIVEYFLPLLA